MSDDLVKRLRTEPNWMREDYPQSEAADRIEAQTARIAELDALLYEARHDLAAFIENAHPHREKYPHIMKDFENDMEIVRRIDAALEGGKK